jgi:putative ABC transport system permease protein
MSPATLTAIDPASGGLDQYRVSLKPGVNADSYANSLGAALGAGYSVGTHSGDKALIAITTLITMLTLLIIAVAGLGVLNTVALQIRERAHDIGVFKALGMTPRQTLTMVVCSVGITGLVAGIIAVPAGILLHHNVLPTMAHAANSDLPASIISIYTPPEMVILALAGLVIAIAGALIPASWAANSRTATALRTELIRPRRRPREAAPIAAAAVVVCVGVTQRSQTRAPGTRPVKESSEYSFSDIGQQTNR